MSKGLPTIQKYMTSNPHSIGIDQTLAAADKLMHAHGIRHLPILEGGKLVGIVTDRDVKFMESFKDVDPTQVKLDSVAIENVFTVEPDARLDEVCDVMSEKKYGCAVVMSNKHLVGIFTWVDALRAMSDLLKTRLGKW